MDTQWPLILRPARLVTYVSTQMKLSYTGVTVNP